MRGIFFWLCTGTVLYTYAGYPLLLWLFARFRPTPPPPAERTPSVTLLIAAYNEEMVIGSKLENSLSLDYPADRLQILVVADGSDDHTPDIVEQFADRGVQLLYEPRRQGKMAAINRALPFAVGEIVVFSDANNFYDPGALRALVAPFTDARVGAVGGRKVIYESEALGKSEGLYWKYESFIKEQETRLGSCTGVAGEILAIRRELFEAPPEHIINDDFYMAMRLLRRGYHVLYAPGARSYEHVSPSAEDEMQRRARIVAGRYQALAHWRQLLPLTRPLIAWQVISHKFLRPVVPLAMAGAFFFNLLALPDPPRPRPRGGLDNLGRLTVPSNWIMLAAQLLFYVTAWLGTRVKGGRGPLKLLYLPTFLVRSNVAALIGLFRFLTGRQSALWERVARRDSEFPFSKDTPQDTHRDSGLLFS